MEKISSSKDIAENKLLIIFILEKLNIAVDSIALTNYVLEQRLMDYMAYQQLINELINSSHIAGSMTDGHILYSITEKGIELLSVMSGLLPETEKNRVDRTYRTLRRHTLNERAVKAGYTPEDEQKGFVRIELSEGDISMLNLKIATASKAEALAMCKNWKAYAPEIYASIVRLLLGLPHENEHIASGVSTIGKTFQPGNVEK
jgi:predicted transcriptional regulator